LISGRSGATIPFRTAIGTTEDRGRHGEALDELSPGIEPRGEERRGIAGPDVGTGLETSAELLKDLPALGVRGDGDRWRH
jgi:hypothetical protein